MQVKLSLLACSGSPTILNSKSGVRLTAQHAVETDNTDDKMFLFLLTGRQYCSKWQEIVYISICYKVLWKTNIELLKTSTF